MKTINYVMLSCLFALLGSCTEEVQQQGKQPVPDGGDEAATRQEVMLSLKNKLVLDPGKTKAETIASAEENAIASLDVYVFASETESGEYSFMERFAYRSDPDATLPAGANKLQLTAVDADAKETTGLLKVKKGMFVKLYCIANNTRLIDPATNKTVEAAGFIPLTVSGNEGEKQTIATAGKPLESTFASYHTHLLTATAAADTLATPLAMTGALTTPLDLTDFGSAARVQAGIRLTRLVARYDIINEAGTSRFTIETVSMGNARRGSGLFPIRPYGELPQAKPDELITTPVRRFYGENANNGNQTGAFYSYPSPIKDNGFLILKGMYKINESESKEVSYQIPFTQRTADGNETFLEIANNHRYTLAITAADEYHLDCTLTVAEWADDGSIDDFKPDQDSGELSVAIPTGFTGDTKYDPDTRSVSMSLKPGSEFDVTTTATANLFVYKKYVGGPSAQQYDWLEVSKPAITTKAAAMNYNYTFSLKDGYTLGRYPRAILRFTNTMNGSETTFFVEAVAVPQADNTPQPGKDNPNSFDADNLLVNLYRTTSNKAYVRITCPDGVDVESKPDWLDVDIYKQNGAETIYSFTLNNIDVTGVPDNKGTVVFRNKKANELKTDITVQLLDAALKPDFNNSSIDGTKNSYEAPTSNTPGNIYMQISDENKFYISCKSMQGIEVGMDFDGGPEWLKVAGAPVTKTQNENTELAFSLDNAKLGGAKKATITLKNKVGGKNTIFTVSPVFPVPTVTFVSGSNSPTQNTMSSNTIKLYQVAGSKVSIKASALGGISAKILTGDITVTTKTDDYAAEKTYDVTWKSGATASFVITNKSDEAKETAIYTVNAPATTITATDNLDMKTLTNQNVSNTINSPEGCTASVDWGTNGQVWFDLSATNFNANNQTLKMTTKSNITSLTNIQKATVTLTNKITGGVTKTFTVTPLFQLLSIKETSITVNSLTGDNVKMYKGYSSTIPSSPSTITIEVTSVGGSVIEVSNGLVVTSAKESNNTVASYTISAPYNIAKGNGSFIKIKNKKNALSFKNFNTTIENWMIYPKTNQPAMQIGIYWAAETNEGVMTWDNAQNACPSGWGLPNKSSGLWLIKNVLSDMLNKFLLPISGMYNSGHGNLYWTTATEWGMGIVLSSSSTVYNPQISSNNIVVYDLASYNNGRMLGVRCIKNR